MSETELIQQAQQAAPAAGVGGIGGAVVAILAAFRMFATPKDIDLAKSEMRTEMAEKYLTKAALEPVMRELNYIREAVDKIRDK